MKSPEKFSPEGAFEQRFETPDAVGASLLERGWTKEQLGKFPVAMQTMADAMAHPPEGGSAAGKMNFDLAIADDEDGDEAATVTIVGEGKGLGPEQISELIDKGELFVEVFTQADPEFFVDQNKVILRRKKSRAPEVDTIQDK
jgi:hypothetical protein